MIATAAANKSDYGVDAPPVLRTLFLFGVPCLLLGVFGPRHITLSRLDLLPRPIASGRLFRRKALG